ncbi:MAG: hypothetical protein LBR21_00565, partial [Propionibacteriaceae bacterium]|nr:hypothetical protein [Propionibacteriaceae bacterium]
MRRGVSLVVGLLTLAAIACVPMSLASFTDTEAGRVAIAFDATLDLDPLDTLAPGTAMAKDQEGCLWIWGYREHGMAGNGQASVPSDDPATQLCLPGDRKVVTADTTSHRGFTDEPGHAAAALADDGTVWTWGCDKYQEVCGRGDDSASSFYEPRQVSFPGLD